MTEPAALGNRPYRLKQLGYDACVAEAETLEVVRCSMCLKNIGHCRYLVHSPHANVCDECVQLSYKILVDKGIVSKWELLRLFFRGTNTPK